jgi:23S rRNA (adenine2030-N6)-methyltransferase
MLAYRHGFHAGNHADVLKHAVLIAVLRHMNLKDKAWRLVDTHAGAGAYDLTHGQAQKHAEFEHGIGRLWGATDLPALLADYVEQVGAAVAHEPSHGSAQVAPGLRIYPGSPLLARHLMRAQDQLRLHELHPTDHEALAMRFRGDRSVQVSRSDGLTGLRAHWPPPSRRGVLLIDPSYELKSDYPAVLAAVKDALTRFAEGTVLVWIPQIADREAQALPQRLGKAAENLGRRGWLHARLTVARPNERGFGLLGSSMVVINPPHTLQESLTRALPEMARRLAQFEGASHLLEAHVV